MIVLGLQVALDQLLDDLAALAGGIRAVKAVERGLSMEMVVRASGMAVLSMYERNTVLCVAARRSMVVSSGP